MDTLFSTRVPGRWAASAAPAVSVTWRVTRLVRTEDGRWKLAAVSDHPYGDWQSALAVARRWFKDLPDDIEHGQVRIRVEPLDMPGISSP